MDRSLRNFRSLLLYSTDYERSSSASSCHQEHASSCESRSSMLCGSIRLRRSLRSRELFLRKLITTVELVAPTSYYFGRTNALNLLSRTDLLTLVLCRYTGMCTKQTISNPFNRPPSTSPLSQCYPRCQPFRSSTSRRQHRHAQHRRFEISSRRRPRDCDHEATR